MLSLMSFVPDDGAQSQAEANLTTLKNSLLNWTIDLVGDCVQLQRPDADLRAVFRDGRILADMLKRLDSRAPDYNDAWTPTQNLVATFEHAETAFDVPVLIDASIENPFDDEQALVAYLCELKHCVTSNPAPRSVESRRQSGESDSTFDKRGSSAVDIDDEDVPAHQKVSASSASADEQETCSARQASQIVELWRYQNGATGTYHGIAVEPECMKIAVGLHRARGLLGGRSINPYCIIKYKDKEVKTHHVDNTPDPEWNHTQLIELEYPLQDKTSLIVIYLFSANTLFADTLLGKVDILLWNLLELSEDEGSLKNPCCLMKRSFLAVTPCDTQEQDKLRHTRFSGTRSVQRTLNVFHDSRVLYKNAGYLGAIEISVFSMGRVLDVVQ